MSAYARAFEGWSSAFRLANPRYTTAYPIDRAATR